MDPTATRLTNNDSPHIPTLSLQVTYQCNIECGHCGPFCGPHETDWMTVDEIKDLIRQAGELGAFNVVFTGGEPTLLGPRLPEVLQYTKQETTVRSTRLVTNAKWAYTPAIALEKLKCWRDAGLDEINISCGEFHQTFVPIVNVINAYRAACSLNFETVLLVAELLRDGYGTISADDFVRASGGELPLLDPLRPGRRGLQCSVAMPLGRGRHVISDDAVIRRPEADFNSRCSQVMHAVTAHPNGNVTACCGVMVREESLLNIGNWRQESLNTIVTNAAHDRILAWIKYVGLRDMKQWLTTKDASLAFRPTSSSICEMCAEVMFNARAQDILLSAGHERDADIIATQVATMAMTSSGRRQ